jgi:prolycopene isomerase
VQEKKDHYDVVIIGAGVSGLTSAALFSRAGMSVAVLEMDARPGGYLAGFRRKDYRFDSAIHWLNQCGEKGFVHRIFSSIGNDFPKAQEQVNIRRFITEELDFMMTNTPDDFRDDLIKAFPHEKKGLMKFFKTAKKLAGAFDDFATNFRDMQTRNIFGKAYYGMKLAKFGLTFVPHVFYGGEEGVEKGLKKYFSDPKLLKLWAAETDLLSCLIPIAWAYNKDYQFPPKGGGQVFPEWLEHVTTSLGNQIFYQTKVAQIVDDGEKATHVIAHTKGQEHIFKADYFVAACDVETLYERMMKPELSDKKFLEKLRSAELYSSAVTLSIGLNRPAEDLGFGDEMLLIAETNASRKDHNGGDPHKSDLSVLAPTVRDKSMAVDGKGTLTVYAPAYFDQYDQWGTERDENGNLIRGERYKQIKQEFADIILSRVEKALNTEIKSHIEYLDIATPITHYRYTGNKNGTMMGARPGKENYQAKIAHYKTPLKNVYLSGHWANLGGGVPIAVSTAANSTLLILKKAKPTVFKTFGAFYDGKIDEKKLNANPAIKPYGNDWEMKPTPAEKKALRQHGMEVKDAPESDDVA